MKRVRIRRAERVTSVVADARFLQAVQSVELLENRRLMSAAVVSQIPAQTLTGGHASAGITLSTYLTDTALTGGTIIEMQTPLGNIPLQLTNTQTPHTVANFIQYITNGEYMPTIIQRSAPGFVLQGGGTKPDGSNNAPVASLQSESGISNTEGTIAMALSTGPNSGTNQWFINLADNASVLDGSDDGGPFTVFGNVIDSGMTVANAIAQLPIINGSAENSNWYIGADDGLPVINYTGSQTPTTVPEANLVTDNIVEIPADQAVTYTVASSNSNLVTGSVSSGVLTLSPASASASGSATVTVTAHDLSGGTASSTFSVNVIAPPIISASSASADAQTAGQTAEIDFPVTLSTASSSPTTISISTTSGTAPGSDFQLTSNSITIPAGTTQARIPVTVLGDSTAGAETFTLTLSALSSNAVFSNGESTLSITGTINPAASIQAPGATTTALTTSSASVGYGAADTFTATVTPATAGSTATGSVTFSLGDTTLGTVDLVNNTATLTADLTQTGAQTVKAVYSGDSLNQTSTSEGVSVDISSPSPLVTSITKAVVPSTGIAGQAIKGSIALTISNPDVIAPQSGTVTVNVYATTSGTVAPDSVVIGSVSRKATYTGNAVPLAVSLKSLPSTLAAGTYTLVARAVDTTGAITASAAGPQLTVAAPVVALAGSFTRLVLPASVVAGSKTSAVAVLKITDTGNITSSGNTQIQLFASTTGSVSGAAPIKSITKKLSILANHFVSVSVPLGAYPLVNDGTYFIVAQVTDPNSQLSSTSSSSTVNIAAAKIDLVAQGISVPAAAAVGKTFGMTLTLSNQGNVVAAGKLDILLSLSDSSTGSNPVQLATLATSIKLQANKTQTLHLKVPVAAGLATGSMHLVATLDPNNAFNDIDPANNVIVSPTAITLS